MSSQAILPGFGAPPVIKSPTAEQTAIIEAVRSGAEDILVEALAGTGKTSTILASLVTAPAKRVLLTSFGREIVDTLTERMPKAPRGHAWRVKTLSALGLGVLRSYGWRPEADDSKGGIHDDTTEKLVHDVAMSVAEIVDAAKTADRRVWFDLPTDTRSGKSKVPDEVKRAARDLVDHWKESCIDQDEREDAELRIEAFDGLSERDAKIARTIAHFAYVMGARIDRTKINYRDMVWLPLVLDLRPKWTFDLVFVDEAQDLSRPQFDFVRWFLAPGARLVCVGDLKQSIYGWRGAVGHEVWAGMQAMSARTMTLTTTFRCAKAIVAVANALVPQLRASEGARAGMVTECTSAQLIAVLPTTTAETFVLSRSNYALFSIALQLWRLDARFTFRKGKDLAQGLHGILRQCSLKDAASFTQSLDAWHAKAVAKAQEKSALSKLDRINQARDTLLALLTCKPPRDLDALIERLVAKRTAPVELATVHGAKGKEADRVYLLKWTFARYQNRRLKDGQRAPISQEELNLEYVATTRARNELIWVTDEVVYDRD